MATEQCHKERMKVMAGIVLRHMEMERPNLEMVAIALERMIDAHRCLVECRVHRMAVHEVLNFPLFGEE